MKVVGLLSGGKDSCYNLLHCVQQGHEIVALATLAPAPGANDELDSYMYQTVGHDAVHLVAQAMQLPLYRQIIKGSAVNQGAEYGSRDSDRSRGSEADSKPKMKQTDETEDLYDLLLQVKQHHPDIEAVSVGAILSNYQRIRVEHVCFRDSIQLQPLTYLWQRSQAQLLAEMTSPDSAPFTSILIKVAGIGLTESDLGKTLQKMQPKLVKLHNMYGAHICGEGGEYETLTLDSPLFVQKIVIDETETVIHSDSAFGSVSYLKITKAHLEPKPDRKPIAQVPTPKILDRIGRRTYQTVSLPYAKVEEKSPSLPVKAQLPDPSLTNSGRWFSVVNIAGEPSTHSTLEEEVVSAFSILSDKLASVGLNLTHLVHVNLYLADQSLFPAINAVYKTHFGVSPPTRACVALRLPQMQSPTGARTASPRFVMSVVAFDDKTPAKIRSRNRGANGKWAADGERKALHVQSRSFWAPANIGPYSQAVVPARTERIYIAGQIGLLPSDLSLPSVAMQNSLAIQHARRIYGAVMGDMASRSPAKGWIEGGVCWVETGNLEGARDAWIAQLPSNLNNEEEQAAQFAGDQKSLEAQRCWLGAHVPNVRELPLMLFATLAKGALPRGAAIEWQLTALTGRFVTRDVAYAPYDDPQLSRPDSGGENESEDEDEVGMDASCPEMMYSGEDAEQRDDHGKLSRYYAESLDMYSIEARSRFGTYTFTALPRRHPRGTSPGVAANLRYIKKRAYLIQFFYVPSEAWDPCTVLRYLDPVGPGVKLVDRCQLVPVDDLHVLNQRIPGSERSLRPIKLAFVWHGVDLK